MSGVSERLLGRGSRKLNEEHRINRERGVSAKVRADRFVVTRRVGGARGNRVGIAKSA
jgi:hypothetical protein